MTNPSMTQRASPRPEDPWPCAISLDLHNTFVCLPHTFSAPRSEPRSCNVLAVHLSMSVTTSISGRDQHLRITMGLRLPQLRLIRAQLASDELNNAVDENLKCSLDQWHETAKHCCKVLTTFAQRSHGWNALWLLCYIMDSWWTPVLETQSELDVFKESLHNWATGWRVLSSLCTPKSAWFCDVYGPVPFCKWRGHHQCVCYRGCEFVSD